MLNFFNFRKFNDDYLLTNDFGKHIFLTSDEFMSFLSQKMDSELENRLNERQFFFTDPLPALNTQKNCALQNSKNYLYSAPSLHIFVVTTACNLKCVYCQANNGRRKPTDFMSEETARNAVDIALSSPQSTLTFEFQGGEPLLNFPVIQKIVEYAQSRKGSKNIEYTIVSNLSLLTDEMIEFFKKYRFSISTSLDGDEELHNINRPDRNGKKTFDLLMKQVSRLRENGLYPGAIQTTTKASLKKPQKIVDAYYQAGFSSLFLRPLTPLGCAAKNWDQIGYEPEEFINFYKEALEAIMKKQKEGIWFREGHADLFLSKVMDQNPVNYMELRSPCGAGFGQLAYYPDGNIFTCDEGRMSYEMGDDSFLLGNTDSSSLNDLTGSKTCRAVSLSSITESAPGCCDCVYQPYCGLCPVVNKSLYHDLMPKEPNHYRCKIYKGILDTIFELLYESEKKGMDLPYEWRREGI